MGDDLAFLEVISIHSLVIGLVLAFFEPNIEKTKVPRLVHSGRIVGEKSHSILAINEVELFGKVYFAFESFLTFVVACLSIHL